MTDLPLVGFVALSSALFAVGLFGILTRRNFILILIALEIAMNAAILNFVYFGAFSGGPGRPLRTSDRGRPHRLRCDRGRGRARDRSRAEPV